jgi:catechol-2,3-dioxygenase
VTMMSDPAEITAGAHAGGWAVYLRDPDGFTVELYQGPPASPSDSTAAEAGASHRTR